MRFCFTFPEKSIPFFPLRQFISYNGNEEWLHKRSFKQKSQQKEKDKKLKIMAQRVSQVPSGWPLSSFGEISV